MFSFFKKRPAPPLGAELAPPMPAEPRPVHHAIDAAPASDVDRRNWFDRLRGASAEADQPVREPQNSAAVEPVESPADADCRNWFDRLRGAPAEVDPPMREPQVASAADAATASARRIARSKISQPVGRG